MSTFHFFADERLSTAELTAACLDGHLVGIGEGFMPADAVETAWMRGRALLPVLGSSLAATHATAAWVHGAIAEPPALLDVQRCTAQRRNHVPDRRLVYRDVCMEAADVEVLGGAAVSTRVRTVADLARAGDAHDETLDAMLRLDPSLAEPALVWAQVHTRFPGVRRARQVLASRVVRSA